MATTSWPCSTRTRTSRCPTFPWLPATRTRMVSSWIKWWVGNRIQAELHGRGRRSAQGGASLYLWIGHLIDRSAGRNLCTGPTMRGMSQDAALRIGQAAALLGVSVGALPGLDLGSGPGRYLAPD